MGSGLRAHPASLCLCSTVCSAPRRASPAPSPLPLQTDTGFPDPGEYSCPTASCCPNSRSDWSSSSLVTSPGPIIRAQGGQGLGGHSWATTGCWVHPKTSSLSVPLDETQCYSGAVFPAPPPRAMAQSLLDTAWGQRPLEGHRDCHLRPSGWSCGVQEQESDRNPARSASERSIVFGSEGRTLGMPAVQTIPRDRPGGPAAAQGHVVKELEVVSRRGG